MSEIYPNTRSRTDQLTVIAFWSDAALLKALDKNLAVSDRTPGPTARRRISVGAHDRVAEYLREGMTIAVGGFGLCGIPTSSAKLIFVSSQPVRKESANARKRSTTTADLNCFWPNYSGGCKHWS